MSSPNTAAWVSASLCWASLIPGGARWLRVAQREHYLAGSASRFSLRWWFRVPTNTPLFAAAAVALGLAWPWPVVAVGTAAVVGLAPLGLSVRGRTSALVLTRRLRTLAAIWAIEEGALAAVGVLTDHPAFLAAIGALLAAPLVDLACLTTVPVERRLAGRFVVRAAERLRTVDPRIVGITGSYGKTSTKNYLAHLLADRLRVVATPASFNNRAGLARAVNEHLTPSTEVFIAEMGTYGMGEIAELCSWCPPEIAVMTAIGPVHLERFGSEDVIVRAKSEITKGAKVVVLNTDEPRLEVLGKELLGRPDPPRVIRCSGSDRGADVCVLVVNGNVTVLAGGRTVAFDLELDRSIQPTNVACALGVVVALGVALDSVISRVETLPTVPHRLSVATAASGVVIIDDTFNSNPAGTRAALRVMSEMPGTRRSVVATPGMVELGPRQSAENCAFAEASLDSANDLIVIGWTNRMALTSPATSHPGRVITVRTREDAVRWVRQNLGNGDVVLYENDLPDHYP